MSSHPLDETFDVDPSEEIKQAFGMDIEIPDDPTMHTVVTLALKQFKDLAEEANLLDGDSKLAMLDLAKSYLDLAKDTMYKESDLQIKHGNLDLKRQSAKGSKPKQLESDKKESEEEESDQEYISRDELVKKAKALKKK